MAYRVTFLAALMVFIKGYITEFSDGLSRFIKDSLMVLVYRTARFSDDVALHNGFI